MPLCLDFFIQYHYDVTRTHYAPIHFFAWGLQGECALCNVHGLKWSAWQLASSGAEMKNFVFRLKSVEELDHSSPIRIGSADISRLPKGKN
jgi:hypothetical protein